MIMRFKKQAIPKHNGFSLVELMIAVTLGLLIVAAVLQTFIGMKKTYSFTEEFSRVQENGRFAIEFLSRDIRGAGNFGCLSSRFDESMVENDLNISGDADLDNALDLSNPVNGYDNIDGAFTTYSGVVEGTDVIEIKSLGAKTTALVSPFTKGNQMFVEESFNDDCAGGSTSCHEGEILMVTDCSKATVFQATSVTEPGGVDHINITSSSGGGSAFTPGNQSGVFANEYQAGTFIAKLSSYAYYIKNNTQGVPSLYRSRLNIAGEDTAGTVEDELVEGVEDMQILYGEDADGNNVADYFVPADHVTNMADVVSIDLRLLLVSLADNVADRDGSQSLEGTGVGAITDRKLRKVFSTKIAIRNRLN